MQARTIRAAAWIDGKINNGILIGHISVIPWLYENSITDQLSQSEPSHINDGNSKHTGTLYKFISVAATQNII